MAVVSQPDPRKGKKGSPNISHWDDEATHARDRLTSIYHDRRQKSAPEYSGSRQEKDDDNRREWYE